MRAESPVSSTNETFRSPAPLVSLLGSAALEDVRISDGAGSEDGSLLRLVLFARWGIAVTTSSTLPVDSPAALEAMQVKFPESLSDVTLISRLPLGKTKVLKRMDMEEKKTLLKGGEKKREAVRLPRPCARTNLSF